MRKFQILFLLIASYNAIGQTSFLTPYKNLPKAITGKIELIAFSLDNKFLAAIDHSGKLAIWEIESGKVVKQFSVGKSLLLKFRETGELIVANNSGEVKLFESGLFTEKTSFKFSSSPSNVTLDPTGLILLALGKEGIEIFDLKAQMLQTKINFTTQVKNPIFMGYDRFGQQLSVIAKLGQVITWNPSNQRFIRELKLQSGEFVDSRSVLYDASSNYGGDRFMVSMQEVFIPKGGVQQKNPVNGSQVGTGMQLERKNLLVYYDWVSGQEVKRIPVRYRPDKIVAGGGASNLAYFSNDALSVFLVNYDRGEIMSSIKVTEDPTSIAFSDDNEFFAVGSSKSTISLYYVERNTPAEIKIQLPSVDRSYASEPTGEQNLKIKGLIEGTERVSKISINGEQAQNDFKGGFEGEVPLEAGKNRVRIVAETADQKQLVKDFYVTMDPSKSIVKNTTKHTSSGKRVALIIGNANYQFSNKLNNTLNDAKTMEQTLKELGFQVTLVSDGSYEKMKNAVYAFGDQISDVDISLFYYAGHGLEVDGTNYLIPVDADIQSALDVKQKALPLTGILRTMEFTNEEGLNMVILDACRNNPFPTGKRGGSGLAKVNAPSGTLIAYATDPGSTASDGTGANGLYTGVLSQQLKVSQRIEDIFMNTRNKVEELSKGSQRPWEELRLKGVFYLK
jgi:WD40 repeat protein